MSDAFSNFSENEIRNTVFRSTDVIAWPTSGAVSAGDKVYASTGDGNIYVCTTGGTTGGTEPTWSTTFGATTADNGVVWTTCQVNMVKQPLEVALFDTTASLAGLEASTLTGEVADANYARQALDPSDTNWNAPSDGVTNNNADIIFPAANANYANDVRFVAVIGLNEQVLFAGQLNADKPVTTGQTFRFNTSDLILTVS